MSNYDQVETIDAAFPPGTADADRVAAINASTVTVAVAVPTGLFEGYLLSSGFMISLQNYAGATPPAGAGAQAIAAAKMILLMLSSPSVTEVDMTNPTVVAEVTACLGAMVAEGGAGRLASIAGAPFAQSDMNNLLAMGSTTTSQAAQLGFAKGVNLDDLLAARDPRRGAGPGDA